ncbi:MAG: GGDEF domain-containing protein [Bacillota bacterium]|nr:GGDEF domain-containing protein [Bacillota bacterium]
MSQETESSARDSFFYRFAPYLLMVGGVALGTVTYVTHSLLSSDFNQPVWIVVAFVQGVTGYALGRLVLYLRKAAQVDPLTGVCNRRHFHEMLTREIGSAQKARDPIALLLIDVDHF